MIITAGKLNVTVDVYFVDDDGGTAPGEPTTGKLFSDIETGGSASYHRQGAARVDFTLVTQTVAGAHTDGGFIEIDATNMPGVYRLDVPDLAFAAGVDYVVIQCVMAAANNSIMRPLLIDLTDVDLRDSVRGGMTALPNAAADAAGGLPISDLGGLDMDARLDAAISSRLAPTTAARTLDILATGEVPIDFDTSIGTLAAAQIEAGALNGKGDWNIGKTGYSLTQAFPSNFSSLSITAGGLVDITQAAADKVWSTATRTLTAFSTALALSVWDVLETAILTASSIGLKVKNNLDAVLTARTLPTASYFDPAADTVANVTTVATLTGHTAQTGDSFARIGAAGAGLSDITLNAASIDLVWDEVLTGATHNVTNSSGRRLRALQEFQGYELGSVWIDTVNGTAGTTTFENGTVDNPVDNLADAITLAAATGLIRFIVANGSSITFLEAHTNEVWAGLGRGWTLALGGQDISGTHIIGADISGTATTPTGKAHLEDGEIGTVTLGLCHIIRCSLSATFTLSAAAAYLFDDCTSEGTTGCIIDTGVAVLNVHLDLHRFSGELELQNLGQAGTDTVHVFGSGELTINANCVAGGTIEVRGPWEVVDNGTSTVNLDDIAKNVNAILVDTGTDGVVLAANAITAAKIAAAAMNGKGDWNIGKTGYRLSATGVDDILDETFEGTTSLRQFLRLVASALYGKLSGAATTTVSIRDEADTKNRIVATVDSSGNRSAVTLDKTA